jgi:L-serine dehydratase
MDFKTDDLRIKEAIQLAEESGMAFTFKPIGSASVFHPNTVKVEMEREGQQASVLGESRGGGVIRIRQVNGFESNFTASSHTLIFEADDVKGSIAFITDVLSHDDCNIATMTVSRDRKEGTACLILEMDSSLQDLTLEYLLNLKWVRKVINIPDIDK